MSQVRHPEDFDVTIGTVRDGYDSCVGSHGYGSRVKISSMLRDFAKILRLTIAESCFQKADLHRLTWYSNTGGARKETDHVHVGGRRRLAQIWRFFWSAQFARTDNRVLVATLKLKSHTMAPFNQVRLDVSGTRALPMSTNGNLQKILANLMIPNILRNYVLTSRSKS